MNTGGERYRAWQEDASARPPVLAAVMLGVVALAILLRLVAYSPFDISHADEFMQYLEQANRLATGSGIVPWETRFGLRQSLIPQVLAGPMWLGHALAPGTLLHVHLARATFMALGLVGFAGAWRLGALSSWRHAVAALFVVAVWWECILFSDLVLSESLGSAVLLLASALLLGPRTSRRTAVAGGFLLLLGVLIRVQYAPFAAMVLIWSLLRDHSRISAVLLGLALAALVGAASDLAAGHAPYAWIGVNLGKNIGEGIAARFGASPPWQYLLDLYLHLGPGALAFVAVGAVASGWRYRPLLAGALVNIAVHSAIAHKEYRFIWLSTLVLLVLAAIGWVRIVERWLQRRGKTRYLGWGSTLAICAGWVLLSCASFKVTGGYSAFRGGSAVTRLAIAAAERPGVCRLALDDSYRAHVVPAVLPRRVPLSITPADVAEAGKPIPADLARAANALLAQQPPSGVNGYVRLACRHMPGEEPCLYVRPGSCAPDPRYGYQQVLEREGL